ncbi:hypothetical protein [Mycobacteroides abscessus]|uniref:hypothetical protein n=1 Tax=Mycobacteroides abscessus TaxID=36809 RepID=UPI0009D39A94|nr:hypothetical protein [Mycobacteroides abscessus]QST90147.1 hypothetical protein PROPHIGD91-1_6 [Mycobacterium phage prophi91-1]SKS70771.1 Uncharacterised protein [Mycobacteroides abscessus subsp. bolletii]SLD12737.1 Uncharacterised protein [Mycobacteroides abscessus subsp. bolletii]
MPEPTRALLEMVAEMADKLQDITAQIEPETTAFARAWSPIGLRHYAREWTAVLDERDALIEQLTQCIAAFFTQSTQYERVARERATPLAYLIYANFDVKPKGVKA